MEEPYPRRTSTSAKHINILRDDYHLQQQIDIFREDRHHQRRLTSSEKIDMSSVHNNTHLYTSIHISTHQVHMLVEVRTFDMSLCVFLGGFSGTLLHPFITHSVIFKTCSSATSVLRYPHMLVDYGTLVMTSCFLPIVLWYLAHPLSTHNVISKHMFKCRIGDTSFTYCCCFVVHLMWHHVLSIWPLWSHAALLFMCFRSTWEICFL